MEVAPALRSPECAVQAGSPDETDGRAPEAGARRWPL